MQPAPMDQKMAEEPALTIGKIFANKVLLKAIITAFFALAAKLVNITTDGDTVDVWTDAVFYIGIIASPLIAQWESRKKSLDQAAETREAVYAPATVEVLVNKAVDEAYERGLPPVEPKPEVEVPLPPASPQLHLQGEGFD